METLVSIFVAFFIGTVAVVGASVTGQQQELCNALGGTYTPGAADVCPGGKWSNLIKRPKPQ